MSLSVPAPDGSDEQALAPARSGWPSAPSTSGSAHLALAALGFALLGILIYQTGPRELATHVRVLGWWAPLIFVPYAVSSAFDAAGWRVTFVHFRPRLWLLYLARFVGEAM